MPYVISPKTKRCVKVGGSAYRKLGPGITRGLTIYDTIAEAKSRPRVRIKSRHGDSADSDEDEDEDGYGCGSNSKRVYIVVQCPHHKDQTMYSVPVPKHKLRERRLVVRPVP